MSDTFNATILNHYFKQAKNIKWSADRKTPKDWEDQFDSFYNCDFKTTTSLHSSTTKKSSNPYSQCNNNFAVAFDKSNSFTDEEYRQMQDFLSNYAFQNFTHFDKLHLYSFADHVYSNAVPFKDENELAYFIQTEEKADVDSDFCNLLFVFLFNSIDPEDVFVIYLSDFNTIDLDTPNENWSFYTCRDIINGRLGSQITFVLLNNKLDSNILLEYFPHAQFIKLNLPELPSNLEWQLLTAYACNKDDLNNQVAYPCNEKFIFGYETSSNIEKSVLDAQRDFLVNKIFNDKWNVFNNLAIISYSNETSIQEFGTISNIIDVHNFIETSMEKNTTSSVSLCSVFNDLTTMYLWDLNVILFANEFHESVGDECPLSIQQLRNNANFINFVILNKKINTDYLMSNFPQAIFTFDAFSDWGIESYGCQNFAVYATNYPCNSDLNGNTVVYDRSDSLNPIEYQRLTNFLLHNLFIKQWSDNIQLQMYNYPEDNQSTGSSRIELELFMHQSSRVAHEKPLLCPTLNAMIENNADSTNLLFFISKFDKNVFETKDSDCRQSVNKINANAKTTFFKLGPLVDDAFLYEIFPNATIVEWNIKQDKELPNWSQLLWAAFECYGNSPIILPKNGTSTDAPKPPAFTKTSQITPTKLSSTKQTTKRNSLTTTTTVTSTRPTAALLTKNTPVALIVALSVLALLFVICLIAGISWFCFYKHRQREKFINNMAFNISSENRYESNRNRIEEDLWRLNPENVALFNEQKLGSGASANVYLGRLFEEAGICRVYPNIIALRSFCSCEVAIKVLPFYATELNKDDFKQEINFMKKLKYHPHIVCFLGYTSDQIILEYCANGDLMRFLKRNKESFVVEHLKEFEDENALKLKDLIGFAWQVASGMEYFSSLLLVHRDLAARNILLTKERICKISDFGLARTDNIQSYTSKRRMPARWLPPEALKSSEYSTKTDVWSYGVLLYEVFTLGTFPYQDFENTEILSFIEAGSRLEQPEHASDEIYDLMLSCWNAVPDERPTFTEICQKLIPSLEAFNINYNYVNPVETHETTTTVEINAVDEIFEEIDGDEVAV